MNSIAKRWRERDPHAISSLFTYQSKTRIGLIIAVIVALILVLSSASV
ncbi:MAG: hypothetical protein ACR2RV_11125 [Verrucomicrobiales bacterium]